MESMSQVDPQEPTRTHRRIRAGFGVAAVIVILLVATAPSLLLQSDPPPVAVQGQTFVVPTTPVVALTQSPTDQDAVERQAISVVLAERSAAVVGSESQRFMDTVAPVDATFTGSQLRLATNLITVPFKQWDYTLLNKLDPTDSTTAAIQEKYGASAVTYQVSVRYRLEGFDSPPVVVLRTMSFVPDGASWKVVGDVDTGRFRQPWDVDVISLVRSTDVLMLVLGNAKPSSSLKEQASQAVRDVTTFWGTDWDKRVLVVVPRSQKQLGNLLRRDGSSYSALAAIATAERNGGSGDAPANVVWVNPAGFAKINSLGRTIVLRHEILHVATGAAVPNEFPLWLEEGVAEYFGYRDSGVKERIIASSLLSDARNGRVPSRFAKTADFSPTNPRLSQAYEGSWWAARLIVEEFGEAALLRVYRTALAQSNEKTAVDVALRQELGISEAELTSLWRASIKDAA
jgi:hypothetical protein